jgi:hypothetical protein
MKFLNEWIDKNINEEDIDCFDLTIWKNWQKNS